MPSIPQDPYTRQANADEHAARNNGHQPPAPESILDEPPWSPELIDTIAQLGHLWLCHDQDDADLLLRPDAGDLPALCVPHHRLNLLTPELLKPVRTVFVIQRPDDMLGDGFYTRYRQAVKEQLEAVAWQGTLSPIELNEIVPTLSRLWSLMLEDCQRFQKELLNFQMAAIAEEIKPRRRAKKFHQAAEASKVAAPETFTGSQLLAMEFPEPKAAIKGLVVEGTNILGGRPKEGKSFMVLDWCLAVAAGGYALGDIPVEPGDTLYVGLEDSYRRIKQRVEARLRELQAKDLTIIDRFHCRTDWPALDQGGVEALAAWLDTHPNCRLVAFDVLQAIAPRPSRSNGSAYADDYNMLKGLHALVHARGIPTVLVCHTTKARHDNVVDEINATLGLAGKVDTIIVLSQAAPGRWVLKATGRDIERQELAVRFDPHAGTWVQLGDAKEHTISDERKTILAVLKAAHIPLKPIGISEAMGKVNDIDRAAVRRLLFSMLNDEQVQITEDGRYTLPNPDTGNSGNRSNSGNSF
jgi:hypothetical protein